MDADQKAIYSLIERLAKEAQGGGEEAGILSKSLGLKAREVVSVVGAGGKTTFMFRLAKELFLSEKKVVTTTTTKILEPVPGDTPSLFVDPDEEKIKQFIDRHLHQYRHITVARERLGIGKLKGVSSNLLMDLWRFCGIDTIIIEADGAAGRPIKAPRDGEPVIPPNTTLVVGILGVDGVEIELSEEKVFQAERISKMTGIPIGGRMTQKAMATLMTHPEGIFRGAPPSSRRVAFLNKVDIPNGIKKAKGIAKKIFDTKPHQIERVVLGQLKMEPPVVGVIFP